MLSGAVYAEHSKVYMDGSTDFSNNSAGAAGGKSVTPLASQGDHIPGLV